MIRIAMISRWHVHASDYAKLLLNMPDCEIVAVWDEDKDRGKQWAKELQCPFIENYDTLLRDASIDCVVINSPTVMHTELIIKAANAKKHIFTEKVLAITYADCLKIKEAIELNQVCFSISFVHMCRPELLLTKEMVENGSLGVINYARVRNAHNGSLANWLPESFYHKENCGGGAMIDLGAHTGYLLEWLLGPAINVTATFTHVTNRSVEDNAVALMEFQGGAIGVAETSFVTVYTPMIIEVSGSKGSLIIKDGVTYATEDTDGKWVTADTLPDEQPSPIAQWVQGINHGSYIPFGIDEALALTRLMEGMYLSQTTGNKTAL